MRDTTERPEGVHAGTARLVGTDSETIISQVGLLLNEQDVYNKMAKAVNPYGDGKASNHVFNFISNNL
jgi:UDP-N-acetylglucosamine 2-epimerase (non-hydrolysing)